MVPANFFLLSRSRSKAKGHSFRIYGINDYVTIFCLYSVKRSSKPGYIESRYLTAIVNATSK